MPSRRLRILNSQCFNCQTASITTNPQTPTREVLFSPTINLGPGSGTFTHKKIFRLNSKSMAGAATIYYAQILSNGIICKLLTEFVYIVVRTARITCRQKGKLTLVAMGRCYLHGNQTEMYRRLPLVAAGRL